MKFLIINLYLLKIFSLIVVEPQKIEARIIVLVVGNCTKILLKGSRSRVSAMGLPIHSRMAVIAEPAWSQKNVAPEEYTSRIEISPLQYS